METCVDRRGVDPASPESRALLVVASSLFFFVAYRVKSGTGPIGDPGAVLVVFGFYLLAFVCLFAGIAAAGTARVHRAAAYGALALLGAWFLLSALGRGSGFFGTDALLFSRYSVDLLLGGANPYASSMAPAYARYPVSPQFVTYRMDGSVVTTFSYPALAFLVFVPQVLAGVPNPNLTPIVFLLLVIAFLVYESPPGLAVVPPLLLLVNPDLAFFTIGGVFDVVWVLPVLVSMGFWARERYLIAAAALGVAFAVKQLPWMIAPFLGVWLLAESDDLARLRARLGGVAGVGAAAFLLPNLPFLVDAPAAWARSVLAPLGSSGDLVIQGTGLSLVSSMGLAGLPKGFFVFVELVVLGVALAVYYLYFDRLKWAAWVMPGLVLWFHFRSLQNYYVFFVPVAYYSLLLSLEDRGYPPLRADG